MNRRTFIGTVIISAGAASVGMSAGRRLVFPAGAARAAKATALRTAAAQVVLPTAESLGLSLAGARVVSVHPINGGALPIVVEHMGQRFQIDVFRRDPAGVPGVVETGDLSLFVHNEANGGIDTGRERELGARALGAALSSHHASATLGASLMTFAEREREFSGRVFNVEHGGVPWTGQA